MLLKDKVVIVSGIGPGLGIKLAVEAAREGARAVVCAARTPEKLDAAESAIREIGANCAVLKVPTDITDNAQCAHLADETVKQFGCIDALLNSAFEHGNFEPVETAHLETWLKIYNTNVIGTLQLSQQVIRHMKESGHGGAIVMIISGGSGKRVASSFENDSAGAALLHIEFSMPALRVAASPTFTATATQMIPLASPTSLPATITLEPTQIPSTPTAAAIEIILATDTPVPTETPIPATP